MPYDKKVLIEYRISRAKETIEEARNDYIKKNDNFLPHTISFILPLGGS